MKIVQVEIPEELYKEAESLVKEGWFRDEAEIVSEALRRFLDAHRPDLMEKFIRDDVEWGLHGHETFSIGTNPGK